MPRKVTRRCLTILGQLSFLVLCGGALADESHSPNHLAFLIGHAEEEEKGGSTTGGTLLGVEYIRHLHPRWGLGGAFEVESFGNNQKRHAILAMPVSFFPGAGWRLFGAPGVEFSEPWKPDKALARLGVGYEFQAGKHLTLAPEAQVDFVQGGTRVYVFLLAIGFSF